MLLAGLLKLVVVVALVHAAIITSDRITRQGISSRLAYYYSLISLHAIRSMGLDCPMDRAIANVINGELVPAAGGETYDVFDPSTGQVYASAPLSREEDVDRAFSAALDRVRVVARHDAL